MFEKIVRVVNDIVWSPALVGLLILAGLYFTFKTRFVQVRRFGLMLKALFGQGEKKQEKHGVSSFEAFCIALSGRVGTGNIVGVATAIGIGGPGSIFWMWIVALFGASTAFVESTVAQLYKFKHKSGYRGGPANYIESGLNMKWLSILFSIIAVIAYGMMVSTVQSNSIATAVTNSFNVPVLTTGILLAIVLGLVIMGGVKSISKVASIVTPFMAVAYILTAIVVLVIKIETIPSVLNSIISSAIGVNPLCGGIIGSAISMGVKRGIFSNEAGQGSGAIVSASADVSHPAKQGLAQAFSVYVDTLLVCTATAIMILSTGMFNVINPNTGEVIMANNPELGDNYVLYTQAAMDSIFPGIGNIFVTVALIFFAFTTIMAYYFYGESNLLYLTKTLKLKGETVYIWVFRVIMLGAMVFGAMNTANTVWMLGDIGIGLMVWINVIAILFLCPKAIDALKDYEEKVKKDKK